MPMANHTLGSGLLAIFALGALSACAGAGETESGVQVVPAAHAQSQLQADRRIEDEIIYFVLPDRFENGDPSNDRGGIEGGRLRDGYDPTDYGFYHGGDLKGLTQRLDYIQGMGVTAIWLICVASFQHRRAAGAFKRIEIVDAEKRYRVL